MPWCSTDDDAEIFFEAHGKGSTVVFVSGFMGIADIWQAQIQEFSGRWRCVSFDSRGYGRSDKSADCDAYGIKQQVADLGVVLDAAEVPEPAVLVAHSTGCAIAVRFAATNPQRVAGLVLIGSFVSGQQLQGLGLTAEAVQGAVATPGHRVSFYQSLGLSEAVALESAKWSTDALFCNVGTLLAADLTEDSAANLPPTMVLHASDDPGTPLEPCATAVADLLNGSRLEVIDAGQHFPQVTQPDEVNRIIGRHLEHCLPPGPPAAAANLELAWAPGRPMERNQKPTRVL